LSEAVRDVLALVSVRAIRCSGRCGTYPVRGRRGAIPVPVYGPGEGGGQADAATPKAREDAIVWNALKGGDRLIEEDEHVQRAAVVLRFLDHLSWTCS
jgi:hypothetical protein